MAFKIAPKHAMSFYNVRNAKTTDERNALMRRAAKQGMETAALAQAAQIAPSTARKVLAAR